VRSPLLRGQKYADFRKNGTRAFQELLAAILPAPEAPRLWAPLPAAAQDTTEPERPPEAQRLLAAGIDALMRGEARQSVERLEQARAQTPDDPIVLANLGSSLLAARETEKAIGHLERAARLAPREPMVVVNLGAALYSAGRFDEALDVFNRARDLRPALPAVYLNLANTLVALGRHPEAVSAYERTLELDRDNPYAKHNVAVARKLACLRSVQRGNALLQKGDFGGAIAAYTDALSWKGDDLAAATNRAEALLKLGRVEDALESLHPFIKLAQGKAGSEQLPLLTTLAKVLIRKGHAKEAIDILQIVLGAAPDSLTALVHMADARALLGEWEKAIDGYRRFLAKAPADVQALADAGQAPKPSDVRAALGTALEQAGRIDEAIESYRAALAIEPGRPTTLENLADALLDKRDFEGGSAALRKLIDLRPEDAVLRQRLVSALKRAGHHREAGDEYAKATDLLDPRH
jgi:tetratricopeptide (TPR) repeat protein